MPANAITIRPATVDDLPSVQAIINHEILHSTVTYHYEEKTLTEITDWFHQKQRNGFPLIVALQNESVLGYATYDHFRKKAAYRFTVEHSVYLAVAARGKGIGQLLMTTLIQQAKEEGYHLMVAGIDTSNRDSYEFHKRLSFEEIGTFEEVGYKFDRWLSITFMQLFLK
ncbi:MAG: N-acetyltransferase family protein [Bacteroidota bacterium]